MLNGLKSQPDDVGNCKKSCIRVEEIIDKLKQAEHGLNIIVQAHYKLLTVGIPCDFDIAIKLLAMKVTNEECQASIY
jgi:hypothetical protein